MAGKKNTAKANNSEDHIEDHIIEDECYQVIDSIASFGKPPVQLFVNKRLIRALGIDEIDVAREEEWCLSAIEEVHFATGKDYGDVQNPALSFHSDGKVAANEDLAAVDFKRIIDKLVVMGVNRIAFEGTNLFAHPGIMEKAEYARRKGIIPTITTGVDYADRDVLGRCDMFARVNISFENISADSFGGKEREELKKMVDEISKANGGKTEIALSLVISSDNFNRIGDACKFASSANITKVSLSRIKAPDRDVDSSPVYGSKNRFENNLKPDHMKVLVPVTRRLSKRYGVDFEFDCSLFQALAFHNISAKEAMLGWNAHGCGAGRRFIGLEPSGTYRACGGCCDGAGSILDIDSTWQSNTQINSFKKWMKAPAEPCVFCSYLELCRGGCRVVATNSSGNFNNADPSCPIITDFKRGIIHAALTSDDCLAADTHENR